MDIKFSLLEKAVLGITAAFLLVTGGYFLGQRSSAEPYRVETQYRAEPEVLSAAPVTPAPTGLEEDKITFPIDLNTATAEDLQALPGIGEKRAADIIADRETNGPFRIPEDITRVKGIGEGTLAQIIELITVAEGDNVPAPDTTGG